MGDDVPSSRVDGWLRPGCGRCETSCANWILVALSPAAIAPAELLEWPGVADRSRASRSATLRKVVGIAARLT